MKFSLRYELDWLLHSRAARVGAIGTVWYVAGLLAHTRLWPLAPVLTGLAGFAGGWIFPEWERRDTRSRTGGSN